MPPLCRETQSLGQQMLNAPVGINNSGRCFDTCIFFYVAVLLPIWKGARKRRPVRTTEQKWQNSFRNIYLHRKQSISYEKLVLCLHNHIIESSKQYSAAVWDQKQNRCPIVPRSTVYKFLQWEGGTIDRINLFMNHLITNIPLPSHKPYGCPIVPRYTQWVNAWRAVGKPASQLNLFYNYNLLYN